MSRPSAALDGSDSGGYRGWRPTGTAFGTAPAAGTPPDQIPVSGYPLTADFDLVGGLAWSGSAAYNERYVRAGRTP